MFKKFKMNEATEVTLWIAGALLIGPIVVFAVSRWVIIVGEFFL